MTRHLFDFLSQLRFPYLFAVTAIVFLLDLFIPDLVPMADEILLGLGAMLLARIWIYRKKQEEERTHSRGGGEPFLRCEGHPLFGRGLPHPLGFLSLRRCIRGGGFLPADLVWCTTAVYGFTRLKRKISCARLLCFSL